MAEASKASPLMLHVHVPLVADRVVLHSSQPSPFCFGVVTVPLRTQTLLSSLDRMLDTALELDTGRYSPAQSPLILYVFRLVVRVEGFLLFLKDERRCQRTRGLRKEDRYLR